MITFCIPCAPWHKQLLDRAIDSVKAQTIPCEFKFLIDHDKRGPGALRNEMTRQATTEFISYLDADDWVEAGFAEQTIAEYRRIGGNRYIFTDWFKEDGTVVETPCLNGPNGEAVSVPERKPYCGGSWHPLTTLIPTIWVAKGPFDERLPAVEDTALYLDFCTSFRCGHRLAVPLFHYTPGGGRAITFRKSADYDRVMRDLTIRYGGQMGCCGETSNPPLPVGEKQPGDVLAMALWHGNRSEYGRVTQRFYPRIAMPQTAWVDPRDVAQSPALWRLVEMAPVDHMQGFKTIGELAGAGMTTVKRQNVAPVMTTVTPQPPTATPTKPDIARVVRLAQRAVSSDPVFVLPAKDYPSYSAVKRLIELSGYQAIPITKMDVFGRQPYIILTPERLPDLSGVRARVIAWQLEYAGDYTHNYDGFECEVWASDKAWADAHGAKYVLMGSHPDLVQGKRAKRAKFDVTMLAYMTPRRQVIKDKLTDLRWPEDYPGHETARRDEVLRQTKLMLHVHQHENAPYIAPQRIALAASAKLPVLSESVSDPGELNCIKYADDKNIPAVARDWLNEGYAMRATAEDIYQRLCIDHPFRRCIEEALK